MKNVVLKWSLFDHLHWVVEHNILKKGERRELVSGPSHTHTHTCRASSSNMGSSKNLLIETSSDRPYNNNMTKHG